jgi:hypothetical protein
LRLVLRRRSRRPPLLCRFLLFRNTCRLRYCPNRNYPRLPLQPSFSERLRLFPLHPSLLQPLELHRKALRLIDLVRTCPPIMCTTRPTEPLLLR